MELKGVTKLVIAHRLSTLQRCNKVVQLKDGKVESIRYNMSTVFPEKGERKFKLVYGKYKEEINI